MASDEKQIDTPTPPTDPALPGPDAPEAANKHGPVVASYGVRINQRAYEESPTSTAPTLDELETILEGYLASSFPGHNFAVKAERLDK